MQDTQHAPFNHIPVLQEATVTALNLKPDSIVVDATYGRGGHTRAIVSKLGTQGRMLVIDRDPTAIESAKKEWRDDRRVEVVHAPFSQLLGILDQHDLRGRVTGLLFDLGVSSPQLDNPLRGFSFNSDGPLDMRMNPQSATSAADWLQNVEEQELVRVLRQFGEERFARRVANKIKQHERIETTSELSQIVASAIPTREKGKHPATRTFQAIRIAVNNELGELESVLPQAVEALDTGGRLVVISFHSLEDRIVKRFLRDQSKGDPYPPDLPVPTHMLSPTLQLVGKAVRANSEELNENRRARSAVLRAAEKI